MIWKRFRNKILPKCCFPDYRWIVITKKEILKCFTKFLNVNTRHIVIMTIKNKYDTSTKIGNKYSNIIVTIVKLNLNISPL